MYIGPWQEYNLAKALAYRYSSPKVAEGSDAVDTLATDSISDLSRASSSRSVFTGQTSHNFQIGGEAQSNPQRRLLELCQVPTSSISERSSVSFSIARKPRVANRRNDMLTAAIEQRVKRMDSLRAIYSQKDISENDLFSFREPMPSEVKDPDEENGLISWSMNLDLETLLDDT